MCIRDSHRLCHGGFAVLFAAGVARDARFGQASGFSGGRAGGRDLDLGAIGHGVSEFQLVAIGMEHADAFWNSLDRGVFVAGL